MTVKKKIVKKKVVKKKAQKVDNFDKAVKEVKDALIKWNKSWEHPRQALQELLFIVTEIWGVQVDYDDQDEGDHFI